MKKTRLGIVIFFFALFGGSAVFNGPVRSQESQPLLPKPTAILKTISELQAFGNRTTWQKQNEAADYLYARLKQIKGLEVRYHLYPSGGKTWKNVVARLPGKGCPAKVYLFCAHYDSHPQGLQADSFSPGADDNASGVSVLLEGARVLAGNPGPNTLEWVFFSNEEVGHLGSLAYVQDLKTQGIGLAWVVNIDTIGYTQSSLKGLWQESAGKGFWRRTGHLVKTMIKRPIYFWQTGFKNPKEILLVGGRPANTAFVEKIYAALRKAEMGVKKDIGPQCG